MTSSETRLESRLDVARLGPDHLPPPHTSPESETADEAVRTGQRPEHLGLLVRQPIRRPLLEPRHGAPRKRRLACSRTHGPGYVFLRVVQRLDVPFRGARRRATWSFEEHARSQAADSTSSISREERARVA